MSASEHSDGASEHGPDEDSGNHADQDIKYEMSKWVFLHCDLRLVSVAKIITLPNEERKFYFKRSA
jgi:hypothetical protein